jgi:hypothetical protein
MLATLPSLVWNDFMKKILLCLAIVGLTLSAVQAQDRDEDRANDRSSELTPTAPRKVTMANPQKPTWQAEPHGK